MFDDISTSSSVWGKGKKLQNFLTRHQLTPQDILYIGDETRDIEASRGVLVKSVAVTWGFNSEKILIQCNPDYLARSPKDLITIAANS